MLEDVSFSEDDIENIIKTLNPKKHMDGTKSLLWWSKCQVKVSSSLFLSYTPTVLKMASSLINGKLQMLF